MRTHDTSGDFVWILVLHFFGISTSVHSIFSETHNDQVMSPTENCLCLHTHTYTCTYLHAYFIWNDVNIRVLYKQYAVLTHTYVCTYCISYHAYVLIIIIIRTYICMYCIHSLVQYTYVCTYTVHLIFPNEAHFSPTAPSDTIEHRIVVVVYILCCLFH